MSTPRVVKQPNRGSYVEYPDGTTAKVDSPAVWAARLAIMTYEGQVPESLRQTFRDALEARTVELLALDTAVAS